jgi:hypothetical protein
MPQGDFLGDAAAQKRRTKVTAHGGTPTAGAERSRINPESAQGGVDIKPAGPDKDDSPKQREEELQPQDGWVTSTPAQGRGTQSELEEHEASRGATAMVFDTGIVAYVRLVTSFIEGRSVSREETVQMLHRVMRQHRLNRERPIDYILRHLKEQPP